MAFGDVWICPRCKALVVEDDQMWEEPDRCPHCGARLTDDATPGEDD
jgi:DNA-directed RNA polymerase subunit RPC12/RpoP